MKILLVDGANNFIRNYCAVPSLTSNGESNGGVTGFLKSLGYFIRIIQPDKVFICWEGVGGSQKRRAIVKEYKNGKKLTRLNRNYEHELTNPEDNKAEQHQRLNQYLDDLPIVQISVDNTEADDIIAYLTKLYAKERKVIASSDKDFIQLLDENTVIFSPTKKVFMNNKDVLETYNIHPINFALARAIVGDVSDNLLGIRGIGMKNVVKYFSFLGNNEKIELNYLFECCEKNGEKYDRFIQNRDIIINNLKVMELNNTLIGFSSIQKIHDALEKPLHFNATSFRIKLYEDGISSIGENYLHFFRVLEAKEREVSLGN